MANIKTFHLPHYPDYPIYVALFKDVTNAEFLRSQLLAANQEFDYAFLDAAMILTPTHLLSASFHALHLFLTSRAKSRTPHSELVFRLHPNNNIGQSYSSFGISDTSTNIIAVKFSNLPTDDQGNKGDGNRLTESTVSEHLGRVVEGESVEIGEGGEELGEFCDVERVRKVYKLGGVGKRGGVDEKKELESVVLGIMTIKGS